MRKQLVYHVYYGTQGTAGLYIDEIYQVLKGCKNIAQQIFVSFYYPFEYGNKIFFRYSDILHGIRNRRLRLVIRYIELVFAMIFLLFSTIKNRPQIINYSLLSKLYFPEFVYIIIVKLFNISKIVFTCHDVIPFGDMSTLSQIRRKKILKLADYLLVHNENSKQELVNIYGINESKIFIHLFPIMDLRKMRYKLDDKIIYDFIFQGGLRKEKGIDILLKAWELFHQKYPTATLLIAGQSCGQIFDMGKMRQQNIIVDLRYVSDKDYCNYISQSYCMILPYIRGTNSGIPSSVLSLERNVIASNISMFRNNPLIDAENLFEVGNPKDLYRVMLCMYKGRKKEDKTLISDYRKEFSSQVIKVYENLFNRV